MRFASRSVSLHVRLVQGFLLLEVEDVRDDERNDREDREESLDTNEVGRRGVVTRDGDLARAIIGVRVGDIFTIGVNSKDLDVVGGSGGVRGDFDSRRTITDGDFLLHELRQLGNLPALLVLVDGLVELSPRTVDDLVISVAQLDGDGRLVVAGEAIPGDRDRAMRAGELRGTAIGGASSCATDVDGGRESGGCQFVVVRRGVGTSVGDSQEGEDCAGEAGHIESDARDSWRVVLWTAQGLSRVYSIEFAVKPIFTTSTKSPRCFEIPNVVL